MRRYDSYISRARIYKLWLPFLQLILKYVYGLNQSIYIRITRLPYVP